jgi:hypothetical protein
VLEADRRGSRFERAGREVDEPLFEEQTA